MRRAPLAFICCLFATASAPAQDKDWLTALVTSTDAAQRARLLADHRAELAVGHVRGFCRAALRGTDAAATGRLLTVADEVADLLADDDAHAFAALYRGYFAARGGDDTQAGALFERSATLYARLAKDQPRRCAQAWRALAAWRTKDPGTAREWFARSLDEPGPLASWLAKQAAPDGDLVAGWAWMQRGLWDEDLQRWADAATSYEQATTAFEHGRHTRGVAASCDRAGLCHYYLSHLDQATRLYERALAAANACQDAFAIGRAWLGFAEIANDRADNPGMNSALDKAEAAFGTANSVISLARVHYLRANALLNLGQHDQVDKPLAQAEECYRRAGSPGGVASCEFLRGTTWLHMGNRARAMVALDKAAAQFEADHDRLDLANVRVKQAHACRMVGLDDRARALADEALGIYRELDDRLGQANCLRALARIADAQGRRADAMDLYQQALKLHEAVGDPIGAADAHTGLGRLLRDDAGTLEQAVDHLLKAYDAYVKAGDEHSAGIPALALGDVCAKAGDAKLARNAYYRALSCGQKSNSLTLIASGAQRLGRWCEMLDKPNWEVALEYYRMAVDTVEQLRQQAGGQEAQQGLLADYTDCYEGLARVLLRLGRPEDAFAAAEQAHARTLLDLVADAGLNTSAGLSVVQKLAEAQHERELTNANLALAMALAAPDADPAQATKLRDQLGAARQKLEGLRETLFLASPAARSRRGGQPASASDLAGTLPADTALVEYLVGQNDTVAFVVTNQGGVKVQAVPLGLRAGAVWDEVDAYRGALANPRRKYRQRGLEVSAALMQPCLARLPAGISRLAIVPDGALFELPFAALPLSETEFLCDRYELSLAVSASLLRGALARPATDGTDGLLTFANPTFGTVVRAPALLSGAALAELPGTATEAVGVAQAFGQGAQTYLRDQATEETAKREMGGYRFVHFATHGLLDSASPLYSSVALAEPAAGSAEDGDLEAREILDLKLDADLVTLSACETGRGKVRPGEGLLGLAWAFTAAGARTVVVSQWKVSDETTPALMKSFYEGMRRGQGKAAALRAAERNLREQWPHPYYWAPFVVMGSWR